MTTEKELAESVGATMLISILAMVGAELSRVAVQLAQPGQAEAPIPTSLAGLKCVQVLVRELTSRGIALPAEVVAALDAAAIRAEVKVDAAIERDRAEYRARQEQMS
jgi:hypothetical protein